MSVAVLPLDRLIPYYKSHSLTWNNGMSWFEGKELKLQISVETHTTSQLKERAWQVLTADDLKLENLKVKTCLKVSPILLLLIVITETKLTPRQI